MRRLTLVLAVAIAVLIVLPVVQARADSLHLRYNWGPTAGTAHRNQSLPFNFQWGHDEGPTDVSMRLVVLNRSGKKLASRSFDAPVNKWCQVKIRCVWKKGRYPVMVYAHDSEGDKADLYPYKMAFVIY